MRPRNLKRTIKEWAEIVTNTHISRTLPHGNDVFNDLGRFFPEYSPSIIFDVGANVGQTTQIYVRRFPAARVFSFEPVGSTFQVLAEMFRADPHVSCYQLALGAAEGTGKMVTTGSSAMAFLNDFQPGRRSGDGVPEQQTSVTTIDEFCRRAAITRIDYLKIDTEGADLEVLKGASATLGARRIGVIEVEAGMNPDNYRHVPLNKFKEHLEPRGYRLFGLYEQVHEWPTGQPFLRRTNPVFLAEHLGSPSWNIGGI